MSSIPKIHTRFKTFDKKVRDLWESYCLVEMMTVQTHKLVKSQQVNPLEMRSLFGNVQHVKTMSLNDMYGALDHLRIKSKPRSTLVDAVAFFEDYLGWVTTTVLVDNPLLLVTDAYTSEKEELKLIKLIVDSNSKEEILDKIIEEKVRGIFYGNPVDFFKKSKTKLRFEGYFENYCKIELKQYAEIVARRNIIAHNDGRIDRKYLREIEDSSLQLNQSIILTNEYILESIKLLVRLAGKVTELIVVKHYQGQIKGTLSRRIYSSGLKSI